MMNDHDALRVTTALYNRVLLTPKIMKTIEKKNANK